MTYEYENNAIKNGYKIICGVDEAGRGPLAGDVFAAAVILPLGLEDLGLDDSKKLSEKKRAALSPIIKENAAAFCVARASVEEIDEMNILNATLLAMRRAVEGLKIRPDFVLVDGNIYPKTGIDELCLIKGDAKSISIAAASILAKVARDEYMCELAKEYPQYMLEKHKGYGTKLHYEMIEKYGITSIHRKSFLKN